MSHHHRHHRTQTHVDSRTFLHHLVTLSLFYSVATIYICTAALQYAYACLYAALYALVIRIRTRRTPLAPLTSTTTAKTATAINPLSDVTIGHIKYRHRVPSPTPTPRRLKSAPRGPSSRVGSVTTSPVVSSPRVLALRGESAEQTPKLPIRRLSTFSDTGAPDSLPPSPVMSPVTMSDQPNASLRKPIAMTTSLSISDDRTDLRLEPAPVVMVAGCFGRGTTEYFGMGCEPHCGRRVIVAHVGPVSSMHDRACELFYMLKGGVVDYGAQHTSVHAHDRYGRTEPGLYANWSDQNPLHFVGHSYGSNTVLFLQGMLEKKMFEGYDTNANWVRSVSAIQSPMRGTTGVYTLGALEHDSSQVHWCSYTAMLSKALHLYEYFDIAWMKRYCDTRLEMWRLSRKFGVASRAWRLVKSLCGIDTLVHGIDNCNYDLSIEGVYKATTNGMFLTNPNTYYSSYVASVTWKLPFCNWHIPPLSLSSLGYSVFSTFAGMYKMSNLTVNYKGTPNILFTNINGNRAEQWRCNDGTASLISQYHYFQCDHLVWNSKTSSNVNSNKLQCMHNTIDLSSQMLKPESARHTTRGVWHVYEVEQPMTHTDIVPFPSNLHYVKQFWSHLYKRLNVYDQSAIHKQAYDEVTTVQVDAIKKSSSTKSFWDGIRLLSDEINSPRTPSTPLTPMNSASGDTPTHVRANTAPCTPTSKLTIDTGVLTDSSIKLLDVDAPTIAVTPAQSSPTMSTGSQTPVPVC